ncbi:hypothetical protein C8J57DRAFT_1643529 [Mycena rebaudengoi]|nr:hypothetical protein C8J57DRAFT_1643529 [Mycena rebaudengoi]
MALPTTSSPDDLYESGLDVDAVSLPFILSDPAAEGLQRSVRNLDASESASSFSAKEAIKLAAVNYVRVEAWKSLRIHQLKWKSPPGALSLLPSMQLDIVLEILGYLHPLELLEVSRTSKTFHELLRSVATDSTWRNSFMVEDHPESPADQLPQCPSQLSGRRWAKLLFGAQICEECDQRESSADVDYVLWRRRIITSAQSPRYDTWLRCIPRIIFNGPPDDTRAFTVKKVGLDYDGVFDFGRGRFWRGDGAAVASQYEAHVTSSGGSEFEAVRCFVQEQQALVEKKRDLTARCEDWARHTRRKYSREYNTMLDKVTISASKRLIAEGFDERDIQRSWYDISACEAFYRMPRLTSRLWNRARPHIVPHVEEAQIQRLARELETRIARWKEAIISAALMALRAPVPGSRNTYYIPPHTIDAFPPIAQLISEDSEEPLSPDDRRLVAALAAAPAFVDAWALNIQRSLVVLLPDPGPGSEHNLQPGLHSLERATSVFKVPQSNNYNSRGIFIGWDGARAHLHWCHGRPVGERPVQFDPQGSAAAAAALAVLLGLDPETVTAAQMDEADARFKENGTLGISSQTWNRAKERVEESRTAVGEHHRWVNFNTIRVWELSAGVTGSMAGERVARLRMVFHTSSSNAATHGAPNRLLLSPIAAADVRRREGPDDYSALCVWSCTLCNHFIPSFGRQSSVRDHLRANHQIAEPAEGEHFIRFLGPENPRQRRVMLFVGGAHPTRYRCHRCTQALPHIVKLFSLRAIRFHVPDRHLVEFSDDEYTGFELLTPDVAAP